MFSTSKKKKTKSAVLFVEITLIDTTKFTAVGTKTRYGFFFFFKSNGFYNGFRI